LFIWNFLISVAGTVLLQTSLLKLFLLPEARVIMNTRPWDFSPVVKTASRIFQCMGVGSIPDWELRSHMLRGAAKKILPCTWYMFLIFQIDFSQSMNLRTTETNMWRLNNMLLGTSGSMKKSKKKFENTQRQMEMKIQPSKTYRLQQKQF